MSGVAAALFYSANDTERAVDALVARGIPASDLSLIVARETAEECFAKGEAAGRGSEGDEGVFAALAANLVSTAAGSASVLACGPLMVALSARGACGSRGGLAAGLHGLGVPEQDAAYFEYRLRSCEALLLGVTTTRHPPRSIEDYLRMFDRVGPPRTAT